MCTSLSKSSGLFWICSLKVPVKKLNLSKNFTANEILHKWLFRFPVRFFLPIYRSLLNVKSLQSPGNLITILPLKAENR